MFVRNKAASKAGRVLIVNSDPEITRILEVNLSHANLEVFMAHNGTDALQIIRRGKSDIIILDQEILDTENAEVLRSLKKLSTGIPVLVIGSRLKHKTISSMGEIDTSYIAKPFDPKEVIALIQRHLMSRERTITMNLLTGLRKPIHLYDVVSTEKSMRKTDTVPISNNWQGSLQAIDSLQTAMDISRKEARSALKNIQRIVSSFGKTVPPELKGFFDQLTSDVQEMAVLCNRSLYLAAEFNHRMEMQEDRLLRQESEQVITSEAILTICRNLTKTIEARSLFDPESSKRVVNYTLAIADEMKVSNAEQQVLYFAAMLKDLALAFSRADEIERNMLINLEAAIMLRDRLNSLWKALVNIPFLLPACNLLLYKHERYDGTGGSFGLKGNNIPLGSRVLAVADAFDALTSPLLSGEVKAPNLSIQEIVAGSGLAFDPHIVSALMMLIKRNELEFTGTESTK